MANVTGCFFHFCKCIYKQIQSNGLQTIYAEDPEFAQYMRCLAALAFIPPGDVLQHFSTLKKFAFFKEKLSGKTPVDLGVQKIFDYMENTWIGKIVRRKYVSGLFPLELWNVYQITLEGSCRTNNAIEAWHNAMQIFFGVSHPSIFKFIKGIKEEQDATEILIAKMMSGLPIARKNKKYEDLANY